ncbi:type I secretion system permease/ATPase [Ferruginivarius sediminum]|uniref:Type I secretion system permease/ATPase n=1 Tax=Ferruginivarius sediminum TaxID=2661937 RepID=A0A369TDN0_9PROT|nr:type I secretion system permease/ATPase [Ferruginivarius sediminum]RDD62267.1 type I secretion system permease/ATPase [Ferruginivarius sediminum]
MALSSGSNSRAEALQHAVRSVRGALTAVVTFSFFINLLMLVAPLYMLQVYDRVLTSRNETTLVMLTIIAVGMLIVFGCLDLVRSRVLVRIGTRLDERLKGTVFASVFQQSVKNPGGGHAQALRDMDTVRDFTTGAGLIAFADAPWVPVFIAIVFLFHPVLGAVALAGALIIFMLALANEIFTRTPLANASRFAVSANSFVDTSLRNAEVVAAMGMLPGIMRRWADRHGDVLSRQSTASDRAGLIMASSRSLRLILQVAMLGVGAYLVLLQQITPGTMIAASIIMGRALAPVEAAVGQWRGFVGARMAYRRLNKLLLANEGEPERMPLPAPQGAIAVERAIVAPPGTRMPVVNGASFQLAAGEALGVVGSSGAGKTSLARALMGVWPVASGSIRLDGADIGDWDKSALGPYLGYLPQDVELFDGTVAENIARFGQIDPEAVVRAARMAGVHELILRLSEGYDTQIGPGGESLSAGQRQRIGLARALYGGVRFVMLDEPNANLDIEGEKALSEALTELKRAGTTVVVITHRLPLLSNVDKILVLEQGQVKAFGPRQEIMAKLTRPSVVQSQTRPRATTMAGQGAAGHGASGQESAEQGTAGGGAAGMGHGTTSSPDESGDRSGQ